MVHRWGQRPGRQRETQTKTQESPGRRLRAALQTREYLVDAKSSQAAPRIWPVVSDHTGGQARFPSLSRCASYFPPPGPVDAAARHSATELLPGTPLAPEFKSS